MNDITPEDLAKACELDPRFQEENLSISPNRIREWLEAGNIQLEDFGPKAQRLAGGVAQIYRLLDGGRPASPPRKPPQKKSPMRDKVLSGIPTRFLDRVKEIMTHGWGITWHGQREEVVAGVIANLLLDPQVQDELRRIRERWGISPKPLIERPIPDEERRAWDRNMQKRQWEAERYHEVMAVRTIPGDLKTPAGVKRVFAEWRAFWLEQQYQAWEALLHPDGALLRALGRDEAERRAYLLPQALPQETYNWDHNRLVWLLGGDPGDMFWRGIAHDILWNGIYEPFILFNKVTIGALYDKFGGQRAVQIVIHTRHITLQDLLDWLRKNWVGTGRPDGHSIVGTIEAAWGKYEPPRARRAFLETLVHLPTTLGELVGQETASLSSDSEDDAASKRIESKEKKRRSRFFKKLRGVVPKPKA